MIGLGTIVNSAAIVAGGLIGHVTGKLFRQDQQDAVNKACCQRRNPVPESILIIGRRALSFEETKP